MKFDICCLSAKHVSLRSNSKYWLGRNQDYMSEWSDISTPDCCFSDIKSISECWSSTKRIQLSSHRNITCSSHDYNFILNWSAPNPGGILPVQRQKISLTNQIAYLAFNNNHSLNIIQKLRVYQHIIFVILSLFVLVF